MNATRAPRTAVQSFLRTASMLIAASAVVISPVSASELTPGARATETTQAAPAFPAMAPPAQQQPAPVPAQTAPLANTALPRQEAGLLFSDAALQALSGSASFKRTQLDIEISKLGEKDAWYRIFPKLIVSVSYDKPLNNYENGQKADSYVNMGFTTGTYDPVAAYIGHNASKVATQLAKAMHVFATQRLLESIAEAYISIDALDQTISCRQEQYEQAKQLEAFYAKKRDSGSFAELDFRSVQLRATRSRMELEHAKNLRFRQLMTLRTILGFSPEQPLVLDVPGSIRQIAGPQKTYAPPSFAQLKQDNIEIKIMKLREKLKGFDVRLAQADHLPKFALGLRTPDPTATKDNSAPYYMTFTASMPLWSWGETVRRAERAEAEVLKEKLNNSKDIDEMRDKWDMVGMDLGLLRERLAIASTERELRELEQKRRTIMHRSGNATYDTMVEAASNLAEARIGEVLAQEAYNKALLKARSQSGEMLKEFIRVDNGDVE